MGSKKVNKFTIILYIFTLIFIVLMLVGLAYSYNKRLHKGDKRNVTENKVTYLVEFEKGSQINLNNLVVGYEESYEFSISNDSKDTIGNYILTFEIITPISNNVDENVVYTLEGMSDSKDSTDKVIDKSETPIPVNNKDIGQGVIVPGGEHKYKLTIKVKNNGQDRNYLNGKVLSAKIKVTNAS
jgi:hypothetical protein